MLIGKLEIRSRFFAVLGLASVIVGTLADPVVLGLLPERWTRFVVIAGAIVTAISERVQGNPERRIKRNSDKRTKAEFTLGDEEEDNN